MFDALIDRQDRKVARAAEPACVEERLQRAQHTRAAIRRRPDAIHEVGAGQLQVIFGDRVRGVVQERARVRAE